MDIVLFVSKATCSVTGQTCRPESINPVLSKRMVMYGLGMVVCNAHMNDGSLLNTFPVLSAWLIHVHM